MKKVCFFGIYDSNYTRNRVLKMAFEQNGFQVTECNVDPRLSDGFKKYPALIKEYKKICHEKFDRVLVCFPGHSVVLLARLLFGKDIIFDAFTSLYDSNVYDRKMYPKFHPHALYDWFLDWSSCLLARYVLLDTNEHIRFFAKTFFVNPKKMIRVLVSADETVFFPRERTLDDKKFIIHFHGSFIPLQGIRYIFDAANLLKNEDILFRIIGTGQEYEEMRAYAEKLELKNVEFVGRVAYEELPKWIATSHICLGIFGGSDKAKRVIPNKVYECVAMGKLVITADTLGERELFTHERNMLFCSSADGVSLAKTIYLIKANSEKRLRIGQAARELFESKLTAKTLGEQLLKDINKI